MKTHTWKKQNVVSSTESLYMRKKLYGPEYPEVAASLVNVGCIHSVIGDLETAKKFFQRSNALKKGFMVKTTHVLQIL